MPTATATTFEDRMRALYRSRSGKPFLIDIPEMRALTVAGRSLPGDQAFQDAIQALYSVTYGLKFSRRKMGTSVLPVLPLEAFWWLGVTGSPREPARWQALLPVPDEIDGDDVASMVAETGRRRALPALTLVRLERRPAERAAQILHVGPYDRERPTIDLLLAFIAEQELSVAGPHHEIYLGDPRRSAPERLRTLIRYAVAPI